MPSKRAHMPHEDRARLYLSDLGRDQLLTKDDEARPAQAVEAGHEVRAELATDLEVSP